MEPPPPKRARSDWGGHESHAAQGREPAYDLSCADGPTTTRKLVVQLALPDAELRPAVATWLELRGSLPPPVQRLRYCWTPAKAARHTGGRIDRAVPGLHNFVLQACKPACSSVTASVLNAAAGKEGRDVGMLLAAVEAAGLRDAVSDLILRPFLAQTVRHPQTDDCTEPVLEFLAYKVGLVSAREIDDHERYYRRESLEALLQAPTGPFPEISHRYFQCRMNNLVLCRKPAAAQSES